MELNNDPKKNNNKRRVQTPLTHRTSNPTDLLMYVHFTSCVYWGTDSNIQIGAPPTNFYEKLLLKSVSTP